MASQDHTAHARPSKPFRPLGPPFRHGRMDRERAERHARLTKIAEVALAMHVIQKLLSNSEAFRRAAVARDEPRMYPWPLNSTQVEGLEAALRVLREQNDALLKAEGFG